MSSPLTWIINRLRGARNAPAVDTAESRRRRFVQLGKRRKVFLTEAPVVSWPTLAAEEGNLPSNPSIVVLLFGHFGDFILGLRALLAIREGFPKSAITLVASSWNRDWALRTGLFDRVVAFDFFPRLNRDWNGPTPALYEQFAGLDLGVYDIAIDLRHDPDTRPCLYRINAKARAGYQAPPEPELPHLTLMVPSVENVPVTPELEYSMHAELRFDLIANAVVSAFARKSAPHPASLLVGRRPSDERRRYAILSLSAGDPIRYWPLERFAQVAEALLDRYGLEIVIIGGAAEKERASALTRMINDNRVRVLIDSTLDEIPALIAQAEAFVGLGTGVTHLAALLRVPTVAVLSGVSPLSVWRPVGIKATVLTGATPCAPCGFTDEAQCPFGVICLKAVSAEAVLHALGHHLCAQDGWEQ
jgi:ADP-heptose:LPS heptosyltransferase